MEGSQIQDSGYKGKSLKKTFLTGLARKFSRSFPYHFNTCIESGGRETCATL